jgi:hypothetical protein
LMKTKRMIITDFYPMRKVENYDCLSMAIVAVARNIFLPELNPFNYEVGIFGIGIEYDHLKWERQEKAVQIDIRNWMDFRDIFQILFVNRNFVLLEKSIGLKCIKRESSNGEALIVELEENLENALPTIVCCNSYHLHYTDYYQRNPGGLFRTYHQIIVYGISRLENKVWIYDPTLKNYYGPIDLRNFIRAVEDDRGIADFQGIINITLHYNGKIFDNMNRELLQDSLNHYLSGEGTRINENLLLFFNDFIYCYTHLTSPDHRNKLLEYGFFTLRDIAIKRQHWWDFLEYYKKRENLDHILDEFNAFKVYLDELFEISNILYTNSLKKKKNLNLERLATKLEAAIDNEKSIFRSLNTKLNKV